MNKTTITIDSIDFPVYEVDTLIIGSGAASLNCADHLFTYGKKDIAIVTEKIGGGTSNNTGSDKQTYYKLSVTGKEPDSPYEMAKSLFDGGAMHGDLALIEATLSAQEFFHLVQIGVQFPHDRFGGFVGYKTDHDPRQRATSAGPWTSHQIVQCLLKEVQQKAISIFDKHEVIALLVADERAIGAITIDKSQLESDTFGMTFFHAQNVVFGVGGPGGLYKTSVYPECHIGAIGLALEVGAKANNLTESQYGLASTKFRWNVSGTYQQVIPRYVSTDQKGQDEQEFLNPHFPTIGKLATDIFLKGYQWPFDPRKIPNYGSSLIDILVYIETVVKKRRVFMDFRQNAQGDERIGGFAFEKLEPEAYNYLKNSQALLPTPIERLRKMNPLAIELYRKNGIDLNKEPLEVAVCAQHNNGGLSGDMWWESNIRHLFPIGEVNGSHGVYRPGGAALNSGQVGSLRAAQRIAKGPMDNAITFQQFAKTATERGKEMRDLINTFVKNVQPESSLLSYRQEFQERMSGCAAHIRDRGKVELALEQAYEQMAFFSEQHIASRNDIPQLMQNRHLILAHVFYLEAILAYLKTGGGSRGSYMVMDPRGIPVLESLEKEWSYKLENVELRNLVQDAVIGKDGKIQIEWHERRPLPEEDSWFETVWGKYQQGEIFMTRT